MSRQSTPRSLLSLPPEIIAHIIANVAHEALHSLCLVSRNIRQWAEPRLYARVQLRGITDAQRFRVSVQQDPARASGVQGLEFLCRGLNDERDGSDDIQIFRLLPNLRTLILAGLQVDYSLTPLLPGALEPGPAQIFARLTACHLDMDELDDKYAGAEDENPLLQLAFIPTLRDLSLARITFEHPWPDLPNASIARLQPLDTLWLAECDFPPSAFGEFLDFLSFRKARMFSMHYCFHDYEEEDDDAAFLQEISRWADTLEEWSVLRHGWSPLNPNIDPPKVLYLSELSKLRVLRTEAKTLFDREARDLQSTLPTSISTLALRLDPDEEEEQMELVWEGLSTLLERKQTFLPQLERVQILEYAWDPMPEYMDAALVQLLNEKNVVLELGVTILAHTEDFGCLMGRDSKLKTPFSFLECVKDGEWARTLEAPRWQALLPQRE